MFPNKECSMKSNFKMSRLSHHLGLLFALGAASVFAQVAPPNAGSLLLTPAVPPAAPPKSPTMDLQQFERPALVAPGGVKVKVVSFRVTGNTVIQESVLNALLSDQVGKELDLAGLDQAASTISEYYRSQGYFVARAYLPAQEIASGNLEIAVIEGRLGSIKFVRNGELRLSETLAHDLVAGAAPLSAAIKERNVERGLMLLNDLPGIDVKSTLVPGATPGTSDLVIETTEGKLRTGSIDLDNFGNKYTGSIRAGATVNYNDMSGRGDQLVVRAMTGGSNMNYGRVAYSLPVGKRGTKLGVAYSQMNYKLGGDFESLQASGSSGVTSLFAVHPLVRSRNDNAYLTATYDAKRLSDDQNRINVTSKTAGVYSLGFSGDRRDGYGGGGLLAGSLTYTLGALDVTGNTNYAANDAITAKTNGTYTKVGYSLSRLQRIDDAWSFYASLSGQATSSNLDSSEKFVLGGTGVRAYPQGEAAGDSGSLINFEARYNVPGINFANMQLVGFLDTGSVMLHQTAWSGWQPTGRPNFPNTYNLTGAGFGLNVYKDGNYSIRSSVAWKLGSNPGVDAIGRDSDGESRSARFWLQASKQF